MLAAELLRDHIEPFTSVLLSRGYATSTAKEHVRLAAELGRWLVRKKVLVIDLDERVGAEFLAHLRRSARAARSHGTAVRLLLSVLRESGVVRPQRAVEAPLNPVSEVERSFDGHLAEERGLRRAIGATHCRWRGHDPDRDEASRLRRAAAAAPRPSGALGEPASPAHERPCVPA